MSDIYHFSRGTAPLLISIPHLGSQIPDTQRAQMTPLGLESGDTDWHLDTLYQFAQALGASVIGARYSRYVVDLNRPPNDESLYPGQTKTGLCPTQTFRGDALYQNDAVLTDAERAHRLQTYWQPYHAKLREELDRIKAEHGTVLLWEAHSIASVLPRLFEGKLPDLNIGTSDGAACAPDILAAVKEQLDGCRDYTWAINGRFKGGYITRHYGAPADNIHAIQLEMCQSTYMDETHPYGWRADLADEVIPVVEGMVQAALRQTTARQR
ncbi:N-formylglutamate deformylase [Achromobacter marplatensis]|uniref:N-formylglutamate deformylase n=1 Tax=Achromobacter marplatensis TaxID=470868 RepID=UPI0028E61569|nr:N-formylglutamate deformylase [Achromobacter marplatensis]